MLDTLEQIVVKIELITPKSNVSTETFPFEFETLIISSTLVELLSIYLIKSSLLSSSATDMLLFIPVTFLFELVFDFFHYWSHRACHHRSLYFIHKKHHSHKNPRGITTFVQDPLDLILTNLLPFYLTSKLISLTTYQFTTFLMYKTYIEIAGHLGRRSYPTTSFPQFIWIPKLLGIELYSEDHDAHHTLFKYNYSKRFTLWDQVFGTYRKLEYKRSTPHPTKEEEEEEDITTPKQTSIIKKLWNSKRIIISASTLISLVYIASYVFI